MSNFFRIFHEELMRLFSYIDKKMLRNVLILAPILFIVFYGGHVIDTIGSKRILAPVAIHFTPKEGSTITTEKRFMQLARAGNYTFMTPNPALSDPHLVEGVFIKKLFIGIAQDDLLALKQVAITIGSTTTSFSPAEIQMSFKPVELTPFLPDLMDVSLENYALYEVPATVSLEKSSIPVHSSFFKSIINWRGDSLLFTEPALYALFYTLIISCTIIISLSLYRRFFGAIGSDEVNEKKETLLLYLTFAYTCIGITLITLLIRKLYHPDISLILENVTKEYLQTFQKSFRPKPVERMQFVVNVLFLPVTFYISYISAKYSIRKWGEFFIKHFSIIYIAFYLVVAITVYISCAVSGFFFVRDSITYALNLLPMFYLVIFPTLLGLFLYKNGVSFVVERVLFILIVLAFFIVFIVNTTLLPDTFLGLTFDPVIYSFAQVFSGKAMLVDVVGLYGLAPFYLTPIFHVVGFSVTTFTVVMSTLICISLFCIFRATKFFIKNLIIRYAGFLFLIFYTLLATRMTPEYYYQYWPLRYLFPTCFIFLTTYYLYTKNRYVYYFSFLIYGIATLWNFDVGVVLLLAWPLVLMYQEVSRYESASVFIRKALQHFALSVIGLLLAIGSFLLISFIQVGVFPDMKMFLTFQKMFLDGYFMISLIPPPHMWTIVIGVYVFAFSHSLKKLIEKTSKTEDAVLFMLSITGLGLFAYYQGQSSDVTLFRVWYPALLIIVISLDRTWSHLSERRGGAQHYLLFTGLSMLIILACCSFVYNIPKYVAFSKTILSVNHNETTYEKNSKFITEHSKVHENILILSPYKQGIYHTQTHTRSAVDLSPLPDIFFQHEMETFITFLRDNKETKVFVEKPYTSYDNFDVRIRPLLLEQYKVVSENNDGMQLLLPK